MAFTTNQRIKRDTNNNVIAISGGPFDKGL